MRQRVWAALGLAAGVFAQGCAAGAPALGTGWLTPMDFDATAGSGADDSAAINAAIAALAKNGAHGRRHQADIIISALRRLLLPEI